MKKAKWPEMAEWMAFAAIALGAVISLAVFTARVFNMITPEQAVVIFTIGIIFMIIIPIVFILLSIRLPRK